MEMFTNIGVLLRELHNLNQTGIPWAEFWRRRILGWTTRILLFGIVIGVGLNLLGWKEVNYLLTLPLAWVIIRFTTNAQVLVHLAEVGWGYGAVMPGTGAVEAAKKLLEAYGRAIVEIFTGISIVLLYLGTFSLSENPWAFPMGLSVILTGYLIQVARGKSAKTFLTISWWVVWIAAIGLVWSLIPASILVQLTGYDIKGFLSANPNVEIARGILELDREKKESQKSSEIEKFRRKAEKGDLTNEDRGRLEQLLRKESLPIRALGTLFDLRQTITVQVPLSLSPVTIPAPPEAQGWYRFTVQTPMVTFTCKDGRFGAMHPQRVGRDRGQGELLVNGIPPGDSVYLDGSSTLSAQMDYLPINVCGGRKPKSYTPRETFVTFTPVKG